ncbi:MAG: NAD(P)H-quinone oxidoreductase [Alphaproteobacteria bacterium]|nr:NAD(P)H-quinone oxidoreductase [Alphaproteobacteria bacterium]
MALPQSMTAIEITAIGGPEVLVPVTRAVPVPGPGEVLIKVAAAGLNRADVLQRTGLYPMPPNAPTDIPGLEASGVVVALGAGASRFAVGDAVCALLIGGGYAEFVAVPEPQCMAIPPGVTLVEAGGIPETYCTVWTNVFDRGRLAVGEVFLAQGGSSGIGITAIQLAKAHGARVLATAGSDVKCAACVASGADRAINYNAEDFVAATLEFTGGRGVDLILDMVAGSYIARQITAMARNGRLVLVGLMGGASAEVDFATVVARGLYLTGSSLRSRSIAEKGEICRTLEARIWPLFASRQTWPVVHQVFPLREAAAAHRLMESSAHIGKILLVP